MSTYDIAFANVIGNEGGYVNDPNDPGGETKFGISKRAYPNTDIANLTIGDAKALYLRDYWLPLNADDLPEGVAVELFDMAVNMGVKTAIKVLQKALGTEPDGIIGPQTRAAIMNADQAKLLRRLYAHRLITYTSMSLWHLYGAGWTNRVANNMLKA